MSSASESREQYDSRYSLLNAWNRLKNIVLLQYEREPTESKIRKDADDR